jgi:hypothetical protein
MGNYAPTLESLPFWMHVACLAWRGRDTGVPTLQVPAFVSSNSSPLTTVRQCDPDANSELAGLSPQTQNKGLDEAPEVNRC